MITMMMRMMMMIMMDRVEVPDAVIYIRVLQEGGNLIKNVIVSFFNNFKTFFI